MPEQTTQSDKAKRNQTIKGKVVSDKMDKTCVVETKRTIIHPLYLKRISRKKKYHVHDEKNEVKVGDTILAVGCRPLSKNKNFRLKTIVEKAQL